MKIGFSGTRQGMTKEQKEYVEKLLIENNVTEFHHGDCIGADAEADAIARKLGATIVIHPPDNDSRRAFCAQDGDTVMAPKPYLVRNEAIVQSTELLIACPKTINEERRSGTWATVRTANKLGKRLEIVI